mmetsp:Transcript_23856/g.75095  ORF Transcript_23856/g.75095 Transcript_23856/m.75095 type:complete len:284 (-) Transcript_23856:256-1107(-)
MAYAHRDRSEWEALKSVDAVVAGLQERLTLEGTVLTQRAQELRVEAQQLARQRAFLREERRRAREDALGLEEDKKQLAYRLRADWLPRSFLPGPSEKTVRLNVGGQLFEVSEEVLKRDPNSLLAALCGSESPLESDEDGVVFVDRDWWTFRLLLKFLRDGILPEDETALVALYREASFWRCDQLRLAIEELKLKLRRRRFALNDDGDVEEKDEDVGTFWKDKPNWWATPAPDKKKPKPKKVDWWEGTEYHDSAFLPLSGEADKVVTEQGEEDEIPTLSSTWSR